MQHDEHELVVLIERVLVSGRPQSEVYPLPSVDVDPEQRGVRRKELVGSASHSE